MNPVLRWAGSKRKVLAELRKQSPECFHRYFEPFAGSAVLFFDLLPQAGVLGDLNPEVIATYQAIRDTPGDVCTYLYSIPATKEAYYTLRALSPSSLDNAQRAARLIFLMKACFNGVYRTNKMGGFNVPLGSKFFSLPSKTEINAAAYALREMTLVQGDFQQALDDAASGDFVYLDPPYSDGNRFRGEYSYSGAFQIADQERLIKICHQLSHKGVKVLLSFKECEAIRGSLDGWSITDLRVNRSVAGFARARRFSSEILACNF